MPARFGLISPSSLLSSLTLSHQMQTIHRSPPYAILFHFARSPQHFSSLHHYVLFRSVKNLLSTMSSFPSTAPDDGSLPTAYPCWHYGPDRIHRYGIHFRFCHPCSLFEDLFPGKVVKIDSPTYRRNIEYKKYRCICRHTRPSLPTETLMEDERTTKR